MSLKGRIREWLGIDGRIRDLVRSELAARSLPQATEVQQLRERIDGLEKKLKMTMGSVQASGAQLMGVHNALDQVKAETAQAHQVAVTATRTAESAADGVESLEAEISALAARVPKKTSKKNTKSR